MKNAMVLSFKSRLNSAQVALKGFPWKIATILYTMSWGWSLLRPNTLYWDDWHDLFQRDKWFAREYYMSSGRPPWEGFLHALLTPVGIWTFSVLTFVLFFVAGIFLFLILKTAENPQILNINLILLVFLITPVNHARIAAIIFQYTSSYFLFFLAWMLLVRHKSKKSFLLACIAMFLSFKTHSFLFFVLLPFAHFIWINRSNLKDRQKFISRKRLQILIVATLPVLYVLLRSIFWPSVGRFVNYQKIYSNGVVMSTTLFIPFVFCCILFFFLHNSKRQVPTGLIVTLLGTFAIAISLFPYLISNNIDRYIFTFNIGWQSRHLILTPLGISFVVVGLSQLTSKKKHYVAKLALILSMLVNIFVGTQYYLQSVQQTEITNLFKAQKIQSVISEFSDETARFKGRGATYSEYEFFGMLNDAGYSYPKRVGYKYVCKANPNGAKLTVKSDKSFLDALLSRNTGTYFEITKCAEDLSP